MRHRSNKIKFKGGKDAIDMLVRKLVVNFLSKGKITTTLTKAKVLKSVLEKLIEKSKEKKESNKNYLLRFGLNKNLLKLMFDSIGPAIKKINGGYVKIKRLGFRLSDGAMEATVEWAYPIVIEQPKKLKSQIPSTPEAEQVRSRASKSQTNSKDQKTKLPK